MSEIDLDEVIATLLSIKSQITSPSKSSSSRKVLRDVANTLFALASRPLPSKPHHPSTTPPPVVHTITPTPPRKAARPTTSPEKRPTARTRENVNVSNRVTSPPALSGRRPQSAPPKPSAPFAQSPRILSPRAAPASFVRSPKRKNDMKRLEAIYGRPSKLVKPQVRRVDCSRVSNQPPLPRLASPTASAAFLASVASSAILPDHFAIDHFPMEPFTPLQGVHSSLDAGLSEPRLLVSPPQTRSDEFSVQSDSLPALGLSQEVRLVELASFEDFKALPTVVVDAPTVVVDVPTVVIDAPSVVVDAPSVLVDAPTVVVDAPSVVVDAPQVLTYSDEGAMVSGLIHDHMEASEEYFPSQLVACEGNEPYMEEPKEALIEDPYLEEELQGSSLMESPTIEPEDSEDSAEVLGKTPEDLESASVKSVGEVEYISSQSIIAKIMAALEVDETDSVHSSVDSLVVQEAALEGGDVEDFQRLVLADLVVEICRRKFPTVGSFAGGAAGGCGRGTRRWGEVAREAETRWEANAKTATTADALMDKKKLGELIEAEIARLAWELKDERRRVGLKDKFEELVKADLVKDVIDEVLASQGG